MANSKRLPNWVNRKNIVNIVFVAVLALFVLYPPARIFMLRGMMKIGLFSPNTSVDSEHVSAAGNVSFRDSTGTQVHLTDLMGKVVFINFWATWCPPCVAELPSIDDLHDKLKANKNVVFLIVDADGDFSKSLPFVKKHGYNLPVYIPASAIHGNMMGNSIPATLVIDKKGRIIFRHDGAADYSGTKFREFLLTQAAK